MKSRFFRWIRYWMGLERAPGRRVGRQRLAVEMLEDRVTPSVNWVGANADWTASVNNWLDTANNSHHFPTTGNDVRIENGATVVHGTDATPGGDVVNSILIAGSSTLVLSDGSITDSTTLSDVGGSFQLSGGTLIGATVPAGSTIFGTGFAGRLTAVTIAGTLDLQAASSIMGVSGGLTLPGGKILLGNAAGNTFGQLRFFGASQTVDGTAAGAGTVLFGANGLNDLVANDTNGSPVVTYGPNLTITGAAGTISNSFGSFNLQGTVAADPAAVGQAAGTIILDGSNGTSWTNTGTVLAQNGGTIRSQGTNTNFSAGTLTGGTWKVFANSTLQLVGGNITTNAADIVLDGANSNFFSDTSGTTDALAGFGTNAAAGRFTIQDGRNFNPAVAFNNNGNVFIGPNSTFTLTNGGTSTGDWDIDALGSLLFSSGPANYLLDNGTNITGLGFATVAGNGTVNVGDAAADVINASNVAISSPLTATVGTMVATGALHISGQLIEGAFNVAAGTLSGTGDVTIDGLFTWHAGEMTGTGRTVAKGGIAVAVSNNASLTNGRRLDNNGTAIWAANAGNFVFQNGAAFNNNGTFDIRNSANFFIGSPAGAPSAFNNNGTFKKTAGSVNQIQSVPFNNDTVVDPQIATVDVQTGTVIFSGGGTGTGTWTVAASAVLDFIGGTWNLNAGSLVSGAGTARFEGGTINLADKYSVSNTEINSSNSTCVANFNANSSTDTLLIGSGNTGGTLGGLGNFTINGLFTWQSGSMTGAGTTTANGGINLFIFGGNAALDGRRLDNSGAATWTNNGSINLSNGAVFNNNGVFDDQVNALIDSPAVDGAFINNGTFRKSSAAGTTNIQVPFTNNGTIDEQTGILSLNSPRGGLTNFPIASSASISSVNGATESGTTVTITTPQGHEFLVVGQTVTINGVDEAGYNGTFTVTAVPNGTTFQYTAATSGLPNSAHGSATFLSTSTLTGGTYLITGTLQFTDANIVTNAANIVLNGPTSAIQNTAGADALANFGTNAAGGSFTIQNGRNYNPAVLPARLLGSFSPGLGRELIGLAFDPASGNVFVYPRGNLNIISYTPTGTQVGVIQLPGVISSDFDMDFTPEAVNVGGTLVPAGTLLAVNGDDSPDRLYAMDKTNGTILASVVLDSPQGDQEQVGIAYHAGRHTVFVVDDVTDQIREIDPATGAQLNRFPVQPAGSPAFGVIFGDLEVDSATGNLLVASSQQNVIRVLTPAGAFVTDIDVSTAGVASNMAGLARDDQTANLYISTRSGAVLRVELPGFNNAGNVVIGAGSTFTLTNGGTSTGDWDIAATGSLLFSDTTASYLLDNGTDITGAGVANVTVGSNPVNVGDAADDVVNINNLTINTGAVNDIGALHITNALILGGNDGVSLQGTGEVTIDGLFTWHAGTLSGSGDTVAKGGINFTGNVTLDGRQLDNSGTATWTAGSQILFEHGAVFNNGSVSNHNAVFDAQVNGSISHSVGDAPAFNNFGTFKKTAGTSDNGATSILVPFNNNAGTVDVQTGELLFRSGGTSTGPWTVAASAQLSFFGLTWSLDAGSKVSGAGTVRFAGDTVSLADTYNVAATAFQFGGKANFNADANTTTLALGGGTLGGSGNFTVNGLFTWTNEGNMTGAGTTFANGGININITGGNTGLNGRRLDNNGTATMTGALGLVFSNSAVFNNNGTFDDQIDAGISDGGGAASTFINNGTFKKSAGNGITSINVPFNNLGTVDARTGILALNAAITNNSPGVLQAHTGGTLALNAAVSGTGVITTDTGLGSKVTQNGVRITGNTIAGFLVPSFSSNNVLSGVTVSSTGVVDLSGGTVERVTGGLTLDGTINIKTHSFLGFGVPANESETVDSSGAGQTGHIVFDSDHFNTISLDSNVTLTVGSHIVIQGQAGTIGNNLFNLPTGSLINNGVIVADAGNGTLVINPTSFSVGTTGAVNTAAGCTVDATGVTAFTNFSGTNLTGGTYNEAGTFKFTGANIVTNAANIVLDGAGSSIVDQNNVSALANFATNAATGSFTIQNGRNFTTTGAFSNAGALTVGAGSTFALPNANTYTQTAGTTNLLAANSTLNPGTLADIQGGSLAGIGTVLGSVQNGGQVNPGNSPGVLTVTGDYTQNAAGVLNVQIGGTNASTPDFDQLHVAGAATLDGTLNVTELGGFHPALNDHYPIVTYASETGDFATKNGFILGNALFFKEQISAADLNLVVSRAQLKFQAPPTETTVGIPIQVKVEVDDDTGALLTGDNVDQVTVTLNQNTFSDSTTSKTQAVAGGVATFNLTINQAATGYQLTAGQNGFADVLSSLFTVNPPVSLSPTTLSDSTVGVPYNKFVIASNGTGNKTMQVSNFNAGGTGLTVPGISANTITFNSTPSAAGTVSFDLLATDNVGATASQHYSFTINAAVTVSPTTLPDSTAGVLYNKVITASNGTGNKTMQVSNFNAGGTGLASPNTSTNTATFNSTPSAAGTISFDLLTTDTVGATTSQHYSFTINVAVTLSPTTLPASTTGILYNKTVTASGGTGTKILQVSNYNGGGTGLASPSATPNTLTFNSIPTVAGTVNFDVTATDSVGATSVLHYIITINAAVTLSPTSMPAGAIGNPYTESITASNGTGTKTMQVSNYDDGGTGLVSPSANPNTLTFNSTPTASGTARFDLTATDTVGATAFRHYTIDISRISLTPSTLPDSTVNILYGKTITASNGIGDITMVVSNYSDGGTGITEPSTSPNNVTFNSTPTAAGTVEFDLSATDTIGANTSQHYSFVINSAVTLSPLTLPDTTVGVHYDKTITASNGTGNKTMLVSNYDDGGTGLASPDTSVNTVAFNSTATTAGTVSFDLLATDAVGATAAQHYSFTINPTVTISPTTLPDSTAGVLYNKVITASNGTGNKTMQISNYSDGGSGLVSPNTSANTVTFNSTPSAAGTVSFDLLATDAAGGTASQHYSFTINAAVSLSPTTLPDSTVAVLYNKVVTALNGTGNKTMQLTNYNDGGTGLATPSTSPNTLTFNGTPSSAGTVSFDLLATDTVGGTASQHYSFTINAAVGLSPTTLPATTVGVLYNKVITASNGTGNKTMSVTNYNAGGTGLASPGTSADTVTFNSTPSTAGTVSFDLLATDAVGATTSLHYSFPINAAVGLSPTTLPATTVGVLYNKVITASNGTGNKTMSVTNYNAGGTGLAFPGISTNSVTFNSTPTAAGTVSFDLLATDSVGATASLHYSFTINAAVSLSPTTLPDSTAGVLYNKVITASNGTGNKGMSVTNYNAGGTGLASPGISANTVTFNSTPSAAGTVSFDLLATDTVGGTATLHYSFTINTAVSFSPTTLPVTTVGVLYNKVITASNGTGNKGMSVTNYNAGGTGLASPGISANTVTFNSTPTAAGTVSFDLLATDTVGGTATLHYSFTINAAVSLSPTTLPDSTVGVLYNKVITASNGTGNKTMSVTNYNTGGTGLASPGTGANTVTFNSSPSAAGTVSFDLLATDTVGATASRHYSFTINAPVSLSPTTLPDSTVGVLYNKIITASNGTGSKTMSVTNYNAGGTGLASPATGANTVTFNSTPSAAGTVSFDLLATDTVGATASQHYSFTINAAVSLSPTTLPNGTANTLYSQAITASGGTGNKTMQVNNYSAGGTGLAAPTPSPNTVTFNSTPNAPGTISFDLIATDTAGGTATLHYSFTIIVGGFPVFDSFTQANGSPLAPIWTTQVGTFTVNSGQANGTGGLDLATIGGVSAANVIVQADVILPTGMDSQAGLVARYSGSGDTADMYWGFLVHIGTSTYAAIYRHNSAGNVWTALVANTVAGNPISGKLRFEVIDSGLTLRLNGAIVASATDSSAQAIIAPGTVGMRSLANTRFDNFSGKEVISDAFTQANSTPLNATRWTTQSGSFTVQSNKAASGPGANLATLNGVSEGDVRVETDVTLAAGGAIGLTVRTNGADYYWATLIDSGGITYAAIYRHAASGFTLLSPVTAVTGNLKAGKLRFEAIGSSLKLTLNGTLIASATNGALATGSAGMLSIGGGTFDNFRETPLA